MQRRGDEGDEAMRAQKLRSQNFTVRLLQFFFQMTLYFTFQNYIEIIEISYALGKNITVHYSYDVSNRALVWLAFETREVVSARRQSTDRQIEPNRPAGCKPQKFSVPPHPPFTRLSLHPWRESGQKMDNSSW